MGRKGLIVGAWKAYLDGAASAGVARAVREWRMRKGGASRYDIAVAPSFPYIVPVNGIIADTDILLCAQDVDPVPMGAYTGHVPPQVLRDAGCRLVIIGHSEMRRLRRDDDNIIRRKVGTALEAGLHVVLCVGETREQRDDDATRRVLEKQAGSALAGLGELAKDSLSIAYEPVWAISSQNPASPPAPRDVNAIHGDLRSIIGDALGDAADSARILYGGSVSADNVCDYMNEPNVDGVLVGSASTRPADFVGLLDAVEARWNPA